jgi:hypothetical protein
MYLPSPVEISMDTVRMRWKFHHVPDGLKDWPNPAKGTEFIQEYVESDPGVRIGYYGYKGSHLFEYARGDIGFSFTVHAPNWVNSNEGDYRKTERHLAPKCTAWIDNKDVARMLSTGTARHFVSDVTDVLFTGVLLNRALQADLLGPPIEQVVFESPELERLNSVP